MLRSGFASPRPVFVIFGMGPGRSFADECRDPGSTGPGQTENTRRDNFNVGEIGTQGTLHTL